MTDFNPFSAVPEDASAPPSAPEQESRSNPKLLIGLGALAAVVIGAGAFLFLSGGDDVEDFGVVAAAPRAAAPVASPAPTAQPKIPAQANLTLGRNPFRPLYVEPAPAPPPPPADLPTSTGGVGTTPVVIVEGGTSGPGAAPAPQEPTAKEHKLVLLRVFGTGKDQSASFSIDGKQQTAKVGTTFGPTAEILLLSLHEGPKEGEWTAVLQVGDGDPFDVTLGDPVFVR
jgi:hypothetical protein